MEIRSSHLCSVRLHSPAPLALKRVLSRTRWSRRRATGYREGMRTGLARWTFSTFRCFRLPDLSKTVEVAEDGTIDLPLLGATPAAGKTPYELQRELSSKLGAKYLQNPQVTVSVKEFNSSRVTVSGAVKNPGVFPSKGETLLQYVTKAGGLDDTANSIVLVLRQSGGKRSSAKFNVADIQAGRADDPIIESGDVLVANTSPLKKGLNTILKVLPLGGAAAGAVPR